MYAAHQVPQKHCLRQPTCCMDVTADLSQAHSCHDKTDRCQFADIMYILYARPAQAQMAHKRQEWATDMRVSHLFRAERTVSTHTQDLPLFARVSELTDVPAWEANKAINRSKGGMLNLRQQVSKNLEDKQRAAGVIGDRFRDHGSHEVLQETLDKSTDVIRISEEHATRHKHRRDAAKAFSWVTSSRAAAAAPVAAATASGTPAPRDIRALALGSWSEVLCIGKGEKEHMKIRIETPTLPASRQLPTLVVHVAGLSDEDAADVMISTGLCVHAYVRFYSHKHAHTPTYSPTDSLTPLRTLKHDSRGADADVLPVAVLVCRTRHHRGAAGR